MYNNDTNTKKETPMRLTGAWLKDQRERSGFTQMDIAEVFDLNSTQYVSNIERGIAPLPLTMVCGLAMLFDVNIDIILDKISSDWKLLALHKIKGVNDNQSIIIDRLKKRPA